MGRVYMCFRVRKYLCVCVCVLKMLHIISKIKNNFFLFLILSLFLYSIINSLSFKFYIYHIYIFYKYIYNKCLYITCTGLLISYFPLPPVAYFAVHCLAFSIALFSFVFQ